MVGILSRTVVEQPYQKGEAMVFILEGCKLSGIPLQGENLRARILKKMKERVSAGEEG